MINFRTELNDEQYAVVTEADGPCLVLAGAGSGKTRTITYRVAYLLEQGVSPEEILLLTFTNKASHEMLERVATLLGGKPEGLWGGTFHSIAARILRSYAPHIGFGKDFTILDADDTEGLISLSMRDEGIDLKSRIYPKASLIAGIISFSRNATHTIPEVLHQKYPGFFRVAETIARVATRYEERKKQANVMDFDDLLIHLHTVCTTREEIGIALSQKFKYILVDEYQDTNTVQAAIVKALAHVHGNVLAVGDDAQSIYSFRAANIQNILQFEKNFSGAKIFRLEYNYRSAPDILALANCVIAKNKSQHKKQLRTTREKFLKPHVLTLPTQFEEAEVIANTIITLQEKDVKPNQIAVLFRAAHHSQMVEVELMKRGIPYEYRGGMRFFERAHIKDILAFLRVLQNVHDVIAWQRILMLQGGIGDKTANMIIHALAACDGASAAVSFSLGSTLSERSREGWHTITRILQAMINSGQNPGAIIAAAMTHGYKEYLENQYENFSDRTADIEQLQNFGHRVGNLSQFLTETSLSEEYSRKGRANSMDARVVLSTIHQAKGLEWDAVFVMRLVQGAFPSDRALMEPNGIEEERRLLYVALTRARHYLFITYPVMGGPDLTHYFEPSIFLSEFDPLLIESKIGDSNVMNMKLKKEDTHELEYVTEGEDRPPIFAKKSFLSNVNEL